MSAIMVLAVGNDELDVGNDELDVGSRDVASFGQCRGGTCAGRRESRRSDDAEGVTGAGGLRKSR
jgi:hypothetical protein